MAEYAPNPFSARGIEFIDSRSGGKYFYGTRNETRTVKFPHPNGQCTTCYHESGLRMECGHFICPDDILDWAWEQLSTMKYEIGCSECGKPIKQDDIIKFGLPSLEEKQFLTTAIIISARARISRNVPSVNSLSEDFHRSIVPYVLPVLDCLREFPQTIKRNCKKEIIEKLINSPKKEFKDRNGKMVNIPTRRACPSCQTLLEHSDGCNLFTCSSASCRQQFCFICLSKKIGGSLICKSVSYDSIGIKCSPAPILLRTYGTMDLWIICLSPLTKSSTLGTFLDILALAEISGNSSSKKLLFF